MNAKWSRCLSALALGFLVLGIVIGIKAFDVEVAAATTSKEDSHTGAALAYTGDSEAQIAPALAVTKDAAPLWVHPGGSVTYTIRITNTSDITFTLSITDNLPEQVIPSGILTWPTTILSPGGIWTDCFTVTVQERYVGLLTNTVHIAAAEGATGSATALTHVGSRAHLPLVLREAEFSALKNPSFEGLVCDPNSQPGWCDGNWTHDTHDGSIHGNIYTPQGWVTWWFTGENYGQPEVKTIPRVPPFTGEIERIRSGNYAVLLFTFYRRQDTGLYQVVTGLKPGTTVAFSAFAHGWSCDNDTNMGYSCGDPWNQVFQVGIEPDGIADPFASSIIWSPEQTSPDYYSLIGPVTAQVGGDGRVCVFLRSKTKWGYKYEDAYWDDAQLVVLQSP